MTRTMLINAGSHSPMRVAFVQAFGSNEGRYATFFNMGDKDDWIITWRRLAEVGGNVVARNTNNADTHPDNFLYGILYKANSDPASGVTPAGWVILGAEAGFSCLGIVQTIYQIRHARIKLSYGDLRKRLKEADPDAPASAFTNERIIADFNDLLARNKAAPAPVVGRDIDEFFKQQNQRLHVDNALAVAYARLRITNRALNRYPQGKDAADSHEDINQEFQRINNDLAFLYAELARVTRERADLSRVLDQAEDLQLSFDSIDEDKKKAQLQEDLKAQIVSIKHFMQQESARLRAENKRLMQNFVDDASEGPFFRFINKVSRVINRARTSTPGQAIKKLWDFSFGYSFAFWIAVMPFVGILGIAAATSSIFYLPIVLGIAALIALAFTVPWAIKNIKAAISKTPPAPDTSAETKENKRQATALKTSLYLKRRHHAQMRTLGVVKYNPEASKDDTYTITDDESDDELSSSKPMLAKKPTTSEQQDDDQQITIMSIEPTQDEEDDDVALGAVLNAQDIDAIYADVATNVPEFIDQQVIKRKAADEVIENSKLGKYLLGSKTERYARVGATVALQVVTGFVATAFVLWILSSVAFVAGLGAAVGIMAVASGAIGGGFATAVVGSIIGGIFGFKSIAKMREEQLAYENKVREVLTATYVRVKKDGETIERVRNDGNVERQFKNGSIEVVNKQGKVIRNAQPATPGEFKTNLEVFEELENTLSKQEHRILTLRKKLPKNSQWLNVDSKNQVYNNYLFEKQKDKPTIGTWIKKGLSRIFAFTGASQSGIYVARALFLAGGAGGVLAGLTIFAAAASVFSFGAPLVFLGVALGIGLLVGILSVAMLQMNRNRQHKEGFVDSVGDRIGYMRDKVKENNVLIANMQQEVAVANNKDKSGQGAIFRRLHKWARPKPSIDRGKADDAPVVPANPSSPVFVGGKAYADQNMFQKRKTPPRSGCRVSLPKLLTL